MRSKNNQRLIVGAHYDVCMDTPGADDNASAVAGMIETARLLIDENPQLDYCVEFVAYANEEPPFFGSDKMGSYIHAHSLNENHIDVLGMICYEMIGYFSDEPGSQEIPQEINMLKFLQESILILIWITCNRVLLRLFIFWQVLKQVMKNLQKILSAPFKACFNHIIQVMDGLKWYLHSHNTFHL